MNGPLGWELTKLKHLRSIWLYHNLLSGTIPPGFGRFLDVLLQNNDLEGTIPSGLFGEYNSESSAREEKMNLNLGSNHLIGTIPSSIGLSQWKYIHLGKNQLSGSLPTELWNATGLQLFDVKENTKV